MNNHPFHVTTVITQWDTYQPKKAGNAVLRSASFNLSMGDHTGTHVDAPSHFKEGGATIDQMPIEDFYTSAVCLDLSHVKLKQEISVAEMEEALAKSGEDIRQGDTVMVYMGFNKRISEDDARWQHDFPGLSLDAIRWLARKGCKIFGVEAISPSPEGETNLNAHNLCGELGITHMEGLCLDELPGKGRFRFVGFPLKLKGCSASPIRAVAIFDG